MKYFLSVFQNIICIILFGVASSVYGMEQKLLEAGTVSHDVEQVIINMNNNPDKNKTTYRYQSYDEKLIIAIPKGYYPYFMIKPRSNSLLRLKRTLYYTAQITTIGLLLVTSYGLFQYGSSVVTLVNQLEKYDKTADKIDSALNDCPRGKEYVEQTVASMVFKFFELCCSK